MITDRRRFLALLAGAARRFLTLAVLTPFAGDRLPDNPSNLLDRNAAGGADGEQTHAGRRQVANAGDPLSVAELG